MNDEREAVPEVDAEARYHARRYGARIRGAERARFVRALDFLTRSQKTISAGGQGARFGFSFRGSEVSFTVVSSSPRPGLSFGQSAQGQSPSMEKCYWGVCHGWKMRLSFATRLTTPSDTYTASFTLEIRAAVADLDGGDIARFVKIVITEYIVTFCPRASRRNHRSIALKSFQSYTRPDRDPNFDGRTDANITI